MLATICGQHRQLTGSSTHRFLDSQLRIRKLLGSQLTDLQLTNMEIADSQPADSLELHVRITQYF